MPLREYVEMGINGEIGEEYRLLKRCIYSEHSDILEEFIHMIESEFVKK